MGKYSTAGQATDDSLIRACAMHAGYKRLQAHTQNWLYINYQLLCTDYYLFIKY